jgi:hypothetical protein
MHRLQLKKTLNVCYHTFRLCVSCDYCSLPTISNKMVYYVLTQLQYIKFLATCFDFYKTETCNQEINVLMLC